MHKLTIPTVMLLLLSGCDESSRVQRRQLVEQEEGQDKQAAAGTAKSESSSEMGSPHGMASPHGSGSPHGMMASEAGPSAEGPEVDLDRVHLTAPKPWVRKEPAMRGFVLAEFALPHAEADETDGRLTVSVAGGSVESNIDRWRQQFGEKPEKQTQEKIDVAGVSVTVVDFTGTYRDQRGMMGPVVDRPQYRMLGAIFEAGGQMHFVKAYGPAKTMAARVDEFRSFVRSLKLKPASH